MAGEIDRNYELKISSPHLSSWNFFLERQRQEKISGIQGKKIKP